MTFQEAIAALDDGRWITRPALDQSFLARPNAMPSSMTETLDPDTALHRVWCDAVPLVHDVEQECLMTMVYDFSEDDELASDWTVLEVAGDWPIH